MRGFRAVSKAIRTKDRMAKGYATRRAEWNTRALSTYTWMRTVDPNSASSTTSVFVNMLSVPTAGALPRTHITSHSTAHAIIPPGGI